MTKRRTTRKPASRIMVVIASLLAASANHAVSAVQTTAPESSECAAPEFRQMDFWVGRWTVRWDATPNSPAGEGTNTVTREYGGCVIQEAFDGGPVSDNLIGHSVSTYHKPLQRWRQTWVDNHGGYFAFVGGKEGDSFVLVSSRPADNTPVERMVFENIQTDSLTWRWQATRDGGASWVDQWVLHYQRVGTE